MIDQKDIFDCLKGIHSRDHANERTHLVAKSSSYSREAFTGLGIDQISKEAESRYEYLWRKYCFPEKIYRQESQDSLWSNFEDAELVYVPNQNTWCPPSQCIWAESGVKIPEKFSIADAYPSNETFFTTILVISKPTVDMFVDSLIAESKGNGSKDKIKEIMVLICGLGVGDSDLSKLIETPVLPIRLASGKISFRSASSGRKFLDYVVLETTIHCDAFKGLIDFLDFTIEEIRDIKPLLIAMGLNKLFSSRLVREVTDVNGGCADLEMSKTLRAKSQAVTRYANTDRALRRPWTFKEASVC